MTETKTEASVGDEAPKRPSAVAQRALAEAVARRAAIDARGSCSGERGGRGGLDPVRYGDWEIRGIAADF